MMMVRKSVLGLLVVFACAVMTMSMAACEKKSEVEKATDTVAEETKEAGDAAKDAADDLTE